MHVHVHVHVHVQCTVYARCMHGVCTVYAWPAHMAWSMDWSMAWSMRVVCARHGHGVWQGLMCMVCACLLSCKYAGFLGSGSGVILTPASHGNPCGNAPTAAARRAWTHAVAASAIYGCSLCYLRLQPPLRAVAASTTSCGAAWRGRGGGAERVRRGCGAGGARCGGRADGGLHHKGLCDTIVHE